MGSSFVETINSNDFVKFTFYRELHKFLEKRLVDQENLILGVILNNFPQMTFQIPFQISAKSHVIENGL